MLVIAKAFANIVLSLTYCSYKLINVVYVDFLLAAEGTFTLSASIKQCPVVFACVTFASFLPLSGCLRKSFSNRFSNDLVADILFDLLQLNPNAPMAKITLLCP